MYSRGRFRITDEGEAFLIQLHLLDRGRPASMCIWHTSSACRCAVHRAAKPSPPRSSRRAGGTDPTRSASITSVSSKTTSCDTSLPSTDGGVPPRGACAVAWALTASGTDTPGARSLFAVSSWPKVSVDRWLPCRTALFGDREQHNKKGPGSFKIALGRLRPTAITSDDSGLVVTRRRLPDQSQSCVVAGPCEYTCDAVVPWNP